MSLALDWLILFLASLTVIILLTGGFRFVLEGVVLSARAPGRPFIFALLIGALRLVLAPRLPFLASRADDWRRRRKRPTSWRTSRIPRLPRRAASVH